MIIDRDNYILAGHGRWRAGQKLGLHDVPAIRLDLAEAEALAFMIADNRLAELATWDDRVLAGQLSELSELSLDFSLETTGFTMGEIDLRIEGLSDETTASDDEADRLPPTANQPAGCRLTPSSIGCLMTARDSRGRCRVFRCLVVSSRPQ